MEHLSPDDQAQVWAEFLKLEAIATKLDRANPELAGAFTGTPSERITRQLTAQRVPGFLPE